MTFLTSLTSIAPQPTFELVFFASRNLQCQKEACPIVRGISMTAANVYKPSISGSFAGEWSLKRAIESVNRVKGIRKWRFERPF